MDDGLIKALDDSGELRDCLIYSPNGTFKTSLLAIALSQLSPGKDRFIQTLQSSSKKIEDYVIMQRPALVMTKFTSTSGRSLFGESDAESLIIGQLLFLRPSVSSNQKEELERLFFMGHGGSVFERVRQLFLSLRTERNGWDQMRKEIATFTELEEIQREWLLKLDAAGLDPFLVDKQVEMCKEEGGIAKTLEFNDEKAFMSFFLNATMDTERSADLYDNVLRAMDKNRNMPQRKKELAAAHRLLNVLQSFEACASRWRSSEAKRQDLLSHIGEAAYVLGEALPLARKEKAKIAERAEDNERQKEKVDRDQQIAIADKSVIHQEELRRKHEELHAQYRECERSIKNIKMEHLALQGGALLSKVDAKKRTLTTVERALEAANSELAPIQKHLLDTQVAYHARLNHEKSCQQEKICSEEIELTAIKAEKETVKRQLRDNQNTLLALQGSQKSIQTRINLAEQAREGLVLDSGESPQEALTRLQEEQRRRSEHITGVVDRRRNDKQVVEQLHTSIQNQTRQQDYNQNQADNIAQWLSEEKQAREKVLSNDLLAVIAGSPDFNPYTSELASAGSDALSRRMISEDQARKNVLTLAHEVSQLEAAKSRSEDVLTGKLRQYYLEAGVHDAKLRVFSEYLDARFDGDVEKIAKHMHSDPARFGGLVALDQDTLEQVTTIAPPDWLVRPVVISLVEPLETDSIPYLVIKPKDLTVYSPRELARYLGELSVEYEQAISEEEKAKEQLALLKEAEELRSSLSARFLGLDHIEAQRQEEKALREAINNNISTIEDFKKEILEKKAAIEESEQLERELGEQKATADKELGRIEDWLKLYGDYKQWLAEVDQLAMDIAQKQESIDSLDEQHSVLEKKIYEHQEKVTTFKADLNNLINNASMVPQPTGDFTELLDLPNSSLSVLRKDYDDTLLALNQAATEKGVSALNEKVNSARTELGVAEQHWQSFQNEHQPDNELVEKWTAFDHLKRENAKAEMEEQLINLQSTEQTLKGKLEDNGKEREDAKNKLLRHRQNKKVEPTLYPELIHDENLSSLREKAASQYRRAADESERLARLATKLRGDIEQVNTWEKTLSMTEARIGHHQATAPMGENLYNWPQLTIGQMDDRVKASEKFETMVADLREQFDGISKKLTQERYLLDNGFAQVKNQIEDKSIRDPLFELVQKLLNTDASSFAYQTADFISGCETVIRNLQMDVDAMSHHVSSLVNSLIDHASDCHQVLTTASMALVPDNVPVYGGESILCVKARLDFTKYREAYRSAMLSWFSDVVEKGVLPQANRKKGDELGTALLYRLLACTGKRVRGGFEIELLKMAGQAGRYVPIDKDLSSGGEGLTSATMLYSVISHIRSRQRQHVADGNGVGFLFMDNPLSKASKASFVHAQLRTCAAFGIQPIFVTGVGDIGALEQFSNRIVITKADGSDGRPKHLKINNQLFNRVVITEELLTEEAV